MMARCVRCHSAYVGCEFRSGGCVASVPGGLDAVLGSFLGGCSRIMDTMGRNRVGLERRCPRWTIPVGTGVARVGWVIVIIVAPRGIIRIVGGSRLNRAGRCPHRINQSVPSTAGGEIAMA